jgi:hypothetical protein
MSLKARITRLEGGSPEEAVELARNVRYWKVYWWGVNRSYGMPIPPGEQLTPEEEDMILRLFAPRPPRPVDMANEAIAALIPPPQEHS